MNMKDKHHLDEEIWFSSIDEIELSQYDKDAAFARFKKRISASHHVRSSSKKRWISCAVVVLMCVISYFSYKTGQSNLELRMADIVMEAPNGSRSKMYLPDGTLVWLNAGSKISYSQGFGVKTRLVRLVGEAYFEVSYNKDLPFIVMSNDATVRVLGTKFNFRDYPMDSETIVSLSEGLVVMHNKINPQKEFYIKPNQRALLDKQTGVVNVENSEVLNAIQWINGRLIFDGELLNEIVKDLKRNYNVEIIVEYRELLSLRFYGDFIRQEQSLGEVLSALAATGKLNYRQNERVVTLYK